MEDDRKTGFTLAVRGVIADDEGVAYLLVSATTKDEDGAHFLIFGPRSLDEAPEICEALDIIVDDDGVDGESDESEMDDDGERYLSENDDVVIFSASQDDEGHLFLIVGRDEELNSQKEDGDVCLWLFALEDDPPPEVVRQVDRITAVLKGSEGCEVDLCS